MSSSTLSEALEFIKNIVQETRQATVKVTFHGGEPLVAGLRFWQEALEGLLNRFAASRLRLSLQSNLWLLNDDLCQLFAQHPIEIGTSLDGPADITDKQRGSGYFARTMRGIQKARDSGLPVVCIASFTPFNIQRWHDVFDFFMRERLSFSVHAVVPRLGSSEAIHAISPEQYARLLCEMLDCYLEHCQDMAVSSFDQIIRSVMTGEGTVCTFRSCLGMFLAIDPRGDIYSCQRLAGQGEYRLGSLKEKPSLEGLLTSPVGLRFKQWDRRVRDECNACSHLDYCVGGCPYNAWAASTPSRHGHDPYCYAYKAVFDQLHKRMGEQFAALKVDDVARTGSAMASRIPLIQLATPGTHPSLTAVSARRIVAAVELARGSDLSAVATSLISIGVCRTRESAIASLQQLKDTLEARQPHFNNIYLHVTWKCQLKCSHCYADAGPSASSEELSVKHVKKLIREAKELGFRQVILTGGEPLVHSDRQNLIDELRILKQHVRPLKLVLRTNFAVALDEGELIAIAKGFDQIVVSLDGGPTAHDSRRGPGTHTRVVRNLRRFEAALRRVHFDPNEPRPAELSLAAVLPKSDIMGPEGDAIRQVADELHIRRVRFRPVLPIGRAQKWSDLPTLEPIGAQVDPMEVIERGFYPMTNCGLGHNLYIDPSGVAFPCYAQHAADNKLGNVIEHSLAAVMESETFRSLREQTVDRNVRCRRCDLRYICGGACRAWTDCDLSGAATKGDCTQLKQRASDLLAAARRFLHLPDDCEESRQNGSTRTVTTNGTQTVVAHETVGER